MRRGQTWRKEGGRRRGEEDEEEEEGVREGCAGQGLSVEKTAMKGNCHAPVLTQEHLSREEHAKCAGHVLTIPPLFYTHAKTHTHTYTSSQERADAPPLERHRLSDSMPVKLSLAPSHMQGKVRLMKKKNTWGRGGSEEESLRHEQTT